MDLRMLVTALLLYPVLVMSTSWYNVSTTALAASYPALSQSNCAVFGSDASSGICGNTCMRKYMTAVILGRVDWTDKSTLTNADIVWTGAHWGDPDGQHIPLVDRVSEHSKTQNLPPSQAAALQRSLKDYHRIVLAVETMSATPGNSATPEKSAMATTPGPTLAAQSRRLTAPYCQTDTSLHTPVVARDPRFGTVVSTVTPSNPFCDQDEPWGFDENERLWMYQNKIDPIFHHKKAARIQDLGDMKLECWNYESCWDNCEKQRLRRKKLMAALFGLLGGICGIATVGLIANKLLNRKKRRNMEEREAQTRKKWENEASPRRVQNVDGLVDSPAVAADAAADSADEESARRAAASFRVVFNRVVMNRRDAGASGSETVPPRDEGAVLRRAC